ncbi:MAG: glycosyltransferase family 4 protein [bacterium]
MSHGVPTEYWMVFLISWLGALVSTPLFRRLAQALDITDRPSSRKVHDRPVPYLGGMAFHVALSLPLLYVFIWAPHVLDAQISLPQLRTLYLAAAGFLLLGVWDDIQPIPPTVKLAVQAGLSVLLVGSGFTIDEMTSPFGGKIPLGWLSWGLSVFWILTIVNAINFIDGLDGLAAGVVFFAAVANFLIALHPWQNFICLISLSLMGATLGFLPYNFSPARIFMGDAGSLYLGALLAGLSLVSNTKGATAMSLSLPLVILSIPLLDTVLTIIRRGRRGFNFFTADREHLHHRLLQLGFTARQVVLCLYGLSFLLSMSAVLAAQLPNQYTLLFIAVFLAAVGWGLAVFAAVERRVNLPGPESPSAGTDTKNPLPR